MRNENDFLVWVELFPFVVFLLAFCACLILLKLFTLTLFLLVIHCLTSSKYQWTFLSPLISIWSVSRVKLFAPWLLSYFEAMIVLNIVWVLLKDFPFLFSRITKTSWDLITFIANFKGGECFFNFSWLNCSFPSLDFYCGPSTFCFLRACSIFQPFFIHLLSAIIWTFSRFPH